ncbi:Serine protease family S09X [Phytophthora cinnamomi]|uniref:Serine protease family S09X n=1 Tax=Phytophthora cinnamomi TaxID=4785 RepID=UPI00355A095B|nr:Serine protease family S09X [Phytophthora cinnamomi]
MQLRHVYVEVPAAEASSGKSRKLLAILAAPEDNTSGDFNEVMLYLHGFPDMGVHPTKVDFASRVPAKLAEFWLNPQQEKKNVAFMTFNFGGVPGSDNELLFTDKTISQEIEDMVVVCKYIRSNLLGGKGKLHVIGLSTGAILGALLRDKKVSDTITVIAGLLDMTKGVHFDFNKQQLEQSAAQGWCWKEFYLEDGCPMPKNVELSLDGIHPTTELTDATAPLKIYVRLDQRYINEYYDGSLDILRAVSGPGLPPLLVIHGDADQDVPFPNGEELFAAAAEPKTFVAIAKANHLLSNSKHMKKALRAIGDHIAAMN